MKRVAYNRDTKQIEISIHAVDFLIKSVLLRLQPDHKESHLRKRGEESLSASRIKELISGLTSEMANASLDYKNDNKVPSYRRLVLR